VATRIQLRRGIASSWTSSNPILASGEVGIETDTNKIKIGDGSSNWTELDYFADVYAASASIIAYINSEIGDLIDSAPALLDTLNELAAAIGDDPSFFSNIATTINSASATAYASASAYTNAASASLIAYTNQEISALDVFSNIGTSPSTQLIVGDSNSDTLTFISGENISISADSSTDSITINSTGNYTNVDSITYPDYIVFDTTPENTSASTSTLAWDDGEGTLGLTLNENVEISLGQEIIVKCHNAEATTLTKGEVVMVSGAQGQRPSVIRAYNTSDATSARTFGIVAENINSGEEGFVVTQGIVKGINTNAFEPGDPLYLSASPGLVTTVKPQAPNHYVWVGVVLSKNSSSGRIYVKPQNGYELDEIHDVRITSIQNDDLIVYNSASSIWVNSPKQDLITTASAAAFASASAYTLSQINALTTTDIEEGTNLYFTNDRAINAGSATYILQTSQQGIINSASAAAVTAVLDGAPGALDTLNELAAALNDDSSFATTVTNSLAAKLDASSASTIYLTQTSASSSYVAQNSTGNEYIQDQASNLFVHSNHTNVTATYDDANNQVILVGSAGGGSAGGGGASIIVSASAPVGAVEGDAWFDNTDGSFYVYDGTFWVETAPEGSGSTDGGSFTRWSKTYSGSATLISGTDDDLFNLNYYPGLEQVFINGILQDISNYTATSGSTIILDEAVVNNDVVEVIAVQSFNIANAYTKADADNKFLSLATASSTYATQAELAAFSTETFLIKAESYTAETGDVVFVNSASGAYTITLPPTPTLGNKVIIADLANNSSINNITVGRNSEKIDGVEENFTIDVNNGSVEFIYTNTTYGWRTI
jgi:hypothetical protein